MSKGGRRWVEGAREGGQSKSANELVLRPRLNPRFISSLVFFQNVWNCLLELNVILIVAPADNVALTENFLSVDVCEFGSWNSGTSVVRASPQTTRLSVFSFLMFYGTLPSYYLHSLWLCVCPAMHARCLTERFCNLCVLFLETHCIQTFIQLKGKKRENMNLATVQMCPDGQMTSERPCVLCGSVDPWPSPLTFIWSSRLNRGFQADQQTETQTTVLFLRLFWSADPNAIVQCVAQSEVSEGIKVRGVQRNFWVRFVLTSALRGFSFISWK